MKILELADHLECNDASLERQREAAEYMRELTNALVELRNQFVETVNGEWGKGTRQRWLPESVKEVPAKR